MRFKKVKGVLNCMQENKSTNAGTPEETSVTEPENIISELESTQEEKDTTQQESTEITVKDGDEITPSDAEEEAVAEPEPYVPKLTEKQQKIFQTIMGLLSGFLVWMSLGLSSIDPENGIMRWLFLIVFVAVMVTKNQIEKRTGIILRTFMKFFLIGLIVFLVAYILYGLANGMFAPAA